MKTITSNIINEIIIKKSKFITYLYHIDSNDMADRYLSALKKTHKDATHICYAYILPNIQRCYDDGEPSGTAGLPMLSVLKKTNTSHILAVVVRYFGGVLLGAGGLIRAYSQSVSAAIKTAEMVEHIDMIHYYVYTDISHYDISLRYLKKSGCIIDETVFVDGGANIRFSSVSILEIPVYMDILC